MRLIDISRFDATETNYDLAVWCCGYEERAPYVPSIFEKLGRIDETLTLYFRGDHSPNVANVDYFKSNWPSSLSLDSTDGYSLYRHVNELLRKFDESHSIRILVDISSMPRDWYAAMVQIGEHRQSSISIDFAYAAANHVDLIKPATIGSYYTVYGCDSVTRDGAKKFAFLGLGFDSVLPLHAVEQFEPDRVHAYIADPAIYPDYVDRALASNRLTIDHVLHADDSLIQRYSIWSLEATARRINEVVLTFQPNHDVVMLPFGPKPFVLASIFVAAKYPHVSCINARKIAQTRSSAPANGDLILSRASWP